MGRPNPPEPITTTCMRRHQWTALHVVFYGPLPTKEYLLVVVDRYSRFPEVEAVHECINRDTKARQIFAVHGIPDVIISYEVPNWTLF